LRTSRNDIGFASGTADNPDDPPGPQLIALSLPTNKLGYEEVGMKNMHDMHFIYRV
jgi:hypothetical protein